MQQKRALLPFFFFLLLATIPLAGCRPAAAPSETSALPYQGIGLHIACPTAETASLLRSRGQPWALRQGVTITVSLYDPAEETDRLPSLSSAEGERRDGTSADVWVLSPPELPRWAAAGWILPLPDAYKAIENPLAWSDLLPTWREQ